MQRGYFDDFRDFRDSKGKVFRAPERLVPASHVRGRCCCFLRCCFARWLRHLRLPACSRLPLETLWEPGRLYQQQLLTATR